MSISASRGRAAEIAQRHVDRQICFQPPAVDGGEPHEHAQIVVLRQRRPGELELQRAAFVVAAHVLGQFISLKIPACNPGRAAFQSGIDNSDRNVAWRENAVPLCIALVDGHTKDASTQD